jgi:hypothetical protein
MIMMIAITMSISTMVNPPLAFSVPRRFANGNGRNAFGPASVDRNCFMFKPTTRSPSSRNKALPA